MKFNGDIMNINKLRFVIPYYDIEKHKVFYYDEEKNYKPIKIFNKIGLNAEVTDYAYLIMETKNYALKQKNDPFYFMRVYDIDKKIFEIKSNFDRIGFRPILDYTKTSLPTKEIVGDGYGNQILKFGFFPQTIIENPSYDTTSEYSHTGHQYSSFLGVSDFRIKSLKAYWSEDGRYVIDGKHGFKVEPIIWYVDTKNKLLISKNVILHGISARDLNCYIYEYFLKEIMQGEVLKDKLSIVVPNRENVTDIKNIDMDFEEQIKEFSELEEEKLELNAINITTFGQGLSEHAKAISDASFEVVNIIDNDSIYSIKDEVSKLNQRKKSSFIFSKNYTPEEITQNNKLILTNIEKSLTEQQQIMLKQIKQFDYTKKLIAIFIKRLNNYLEQIKKVLAEFNNSTNNNNLDSIDCKTIQIILENQLSNYEKAIHVHTIQYQNIDLLFRNYAISYNNLLTYQNTILPGLFTAVAIQNSLLTQQENLNLISKIDTLLDDIISTNNQFLQSSKQIENLEFLNELSVENEDFKTENQETKVFVKK